MRVKSCVLLALFAPSLAGAQVWEKPIAPGLTYRMEVDSVTPRVIHALRYSPGAPTRAVSELAGKVVFQETPTKGRATVSEMVAAEGAIAGINANYFPYTGDPLGAMMRGGELLSIPNATRATFGWKNEPNTAAFGLMTFRGTLSLGGKDLGIDELNAECPVNGLTVNTPVAGFAVAKAPNRVLVVSLDRADFSPDGTTTGKVRSISSDQAVTLVPAGCAVIVAQGTKAADVEGIDEGDAVTLRFRSSGLDLGKVDELVSGGPFLVRDGVIAPDSAAEKFRDDFTEKRHPRTAVGRTLAGDIWFVAVDGRSPASAGATIQELATIMFSLGCRDAINLDGGGSTALNILGTTVNRPSDGPERPVSNAVLFFGPKPSRTAKPVAIDGPETAALGATATFAATESKRPLGDLKVIWSCQGPAAWIDQGGVLHPMAAGKATVTAWVGGAIATKTVMVTATRSASPASRKGGKRGGR